MDPIHQSPTTVQPMADSAVGIVPRRRRWLLWAGLTVVFLGLLAAAGWRYRITRPEYRLARGQEAIRVGDWDTAADLADRLAAAGHSDHAFLLRGEGLLALGRMSDNPAKRRSQAQLALGQLNQINPEGPLNVRAATLIGQSLIELGDLAMANRVLRYVLEKEPENIDAHRGLATVTYDLGQLSDALFHLKEVARLDPADPKPHRRIGQIYFEMGQNELAEPAYREALRLNLPDPAREDVLFELAEVLLNLSKYREAIEVLDAAPGGGQDSRWKVGMIAIRAACLRGLDRKDEAAALLDQTIAAHPEGGALYRIRGQIHLDDNNTVEAIRCLERAVELSPSHYQPHYLLSQAYAAAGRKEDAARLAQKVDELRKDYTLLSDLSREAMSRPFDAEVRLRLAEVCDRLGKPDLAAAWRTAAAVVGSRR